MYRRYSQLIPTWTLDTGHEMLYGTMKTTVGPVVVK